jgi:hypothetical protein
MDYKNCTNNIHASELSLPGGTLPLGVEVQQISFAFMLNNFTNTYFSKYRILNKSSQNWDSVYISLVDDADIGDGSDDAAGCDTTLDLGYIYNFDNNDIDYGAAPPALGYRILQSPMRFTGNNQDTAMLPYGNYVGYKLTGMSAYNVFINNGGSCLGDPGNSVSAYNFMRGKDGCGNTILNWVWGYPTTYKYSGNAYQHQGWYDSTSGDKRQILSCGPFSMNSGQEQFLVIGIITGRGGSNLGSLGTMADNSEHAKLLYNGSFGGTPIGINSISTEVPRSYNLEQNYPNPFNPVTKIKFEIPLSRGVSEGRGVLLKVFNSLGEQIDELVNQELRPGIYEVDWDGSAYSSGVYFYQITSGDFTQTRKMLLIK